MSSGHLSTQSPRKVIRFHMNLEWTLHQLLQQLKKLDYSSLKPKSDTALCNLDNDNSDLPHLHEMHEIEISDSEVFDELRKFRPDVATGQDKISSTVLRNSAPCRCLP